MDVGNAKGADLVTFICVSTEDGAAAVAQQPGRYSAFDPGSFWAAVVAHELGGHNYGCDHRGGRAVPGQKTVMMHNYCEGGGSTPPYFFSNPNIWLNGGRLLGEASCLGAAVSGGDNAYLVSNSCQGVADSFARDIVGPSLGSVIRRWKFNLPAGAAPAGTVIADEVAAAPATVRGVGATFTGDAIRLPGGTTGNATANSIAAYVDLPNGTFSPLTNMTVEVWANPRSAQNFARILEIGRTVEAGDGLGAAGEYTGTPASPAPGATSGSDVIGLSACVGTDLNVQRFLGSLNGALQFIDSGLPTEATVLHHYAVSFTDTASGGTLRWYRDGQLITHIDVTWKLADIEDVNAWLGRSLWSGDAMSHMYFHDVRIHNTAISDRRVLANFLLGPNYTPSNATLTADDPLGQTSFNVAGRWSDGLAPSAGKSYETTSFRLRTPADGTSRTFAGSSLKLSGGNLTWKGTSTSTITVNDLTIAGGCEILNAGSGTFTLAGNLAVKSEEAIVRAANGPITFSANLTGGAPLLFVNNAVTLSGTNTGFTGRMIVGDGRFSQITIDSEARLGANPAAFAADQLTLNRGILRTTATMSIDDANRGIRIGESAGLFSTATGTTLTVAVPLSSPNHGGNVAAGMLIKQSGGTLVLTHPNNAHNGEIVIEAGELRLDGGGRINNGDTPMPVTVSSTLNLNTTGNQIFGGEISGGGTILKNNTGTTTVYGANTFSGAVTVNGGTLYARANNAANHRNFSFVSGITVNNGATLRTQANSLFGWDGSQDRLITVNAGGTLVADSGADVGVGTVTLAGGTLSNLGPSTAYGSWRFDDATDKLLVTQNSTVSATNVKFGNAAAALEVAAGRTLNFTGTITNATSGGISFLTKTGAGTLTLPGTNTHTGATALNAGTTLVNGTLTASAITVASSATLGGTGTAGAVTVHSGGTLAPGTSVGTFSTAATTLTGTLAIEIASAVSADRLNTSGSVTLSGALTVTAPAGLPAGTTFTILNKTSSGAINGAFAGKPQDSVFTAGGNSWVISYTGGNGNDVTLAVATPLQVWRFINFGTAANTGTAADNADPDGDGANNASEYAAGTDPNGSGSVFKIISIALAANGGGNDVTVSFPSVAGRTYRVESSASLTSPSWSPVADNLPGTGAPIHVTDTAVIGELRFYRAVAILP